MSATRARWAAIVSVVALAAPRMLAAQSVAPAPPTGADPSGRAAADRDAIAAELRAFYGDVHARRWPDVLDHFLPAKVTARWAPPVTATAWALAEPAVAALDPARIGSGGPPCAGAANGGTQARVAVVGTWARVVVAACAGGGRQWNARSSGTMPGARDEFWLLRVSGRWKIVHLDLGSGGARD
jgi:hypothetical protein